MQRMLIMGAASAMAEATAREFARRGAALFLVARSPERLQAIAQDLRIRGAAQVEYRVLNARETGAYLQLIEDAASALGGLDAALIAHGTLSKQSECESSVEMLYQEFETNALSVMALSTHLANRFEAQGYGVIAIFSSVAGDRGRRSNYVYGSAKAALSAFTSGLRQRLHARGVHVVTIKPGFVATPMTVGFKKGFLWASPTAVAQPIARAMIRGTPVLYVPWFWAPIMWIIRAIPERLFCSLRL
jgi:decaprenylphospho-beta-D-erythro-pentofuranosid-2-ulose 2-reductase